MGPGVGLQAHQGNVGVYREPRRGTLRLRVTRRLGSLVLLHGSENWDFDDDGLWPHGLRRSTMFRFWNQIANITGRFGAGPKTTQD